MYETDQLSVRVADLALITDAMARLRAAPPTELDGEPVDRDRPGCRHGNLPPTDAVLITGGGVKVVVRPSGTEPKLKCYLEARHPPDATVPVAEIRRRMRARLTRLREEMSAVLGLDAA